jgi:hypothetical protein
MRLMQVSEDQIQVQRTRLRRRLRRRETFDRRTGELKGSLSGSARFTLLLAKKSISSTTENMPKYIIEREIAGAGKLTPEQLQGISQKSCGVLKKLGPQIQWLESYVTNDKVYCVYIAPDEATVREHAKQGGFPANRVSEVKGIIDPTTAEA